MFNQLNQHPTRWQLLSQTALNLATLFALVGGGFWAWYEFYALSSAETAEAQLRKLQIEIQQLTKEDKKKDLEISKLQIETERLPVIDVKLDAQVVQSDGAHLIEIIIELQNRGKLKEFLNLAGKPLRIYPVEFKDCRSCLNAPTKPWLESNLVFPHIVESVVLLPGATQRFRALYQAPKAGTYFVEFTVVLSEQSLKQWEGVRDITNPDEFRWMDSVFVRVPGESTQTPQ